MRIVERAVSLSKSMYELVIYYILSGVDIPLAVASNFGLPLRLTLFHYHMMYI